MIKLTNFNLARNSISKGMKILNNLTKKPLLLNSFPVKFSFSTINNYIHENSTSSLNEMFSTNLNSEFGAKKKTVENPIVEEEVVIEQNQTENNPSKNTKKSSSAKAPKTKTDSAKNSSNTTNIINTTKKTTEKKHMEKEDKNAKSKKDEKKTTKVISTLDENDKDAEGKCYYCCFLEFYLKRFF